MGTPHALDKLTNTNVAGNLDPFTLPYWMVDTAPVVESRVALTVEVWVSQNVMLPSGFPVASSKVMSSAARQDTCSPSRNHTGLACEGYR